MSGGPASAVAFTVIGGFLGAGKTTLVNRLLRATRDVRLVVLVNDFGAINIDAALIAAADGDTIALTNGCACCAVGDDFGRGILKALARKPPPEHILVEASGVADPGVLAEIAMLDPDLALNGVIVLADATALAAQLADRRIGDTVRRQLAAADIVLMTKADLASPASLAASLEAAQRVASHAAIRQATLGDVPPEVVLGPATRRARTAGLDKLSHADIFSSLTLEQTGEVDEARLRATLAGLDDGILRVKGVVWVAGAPHPRLVQRVGRRIEITDDAPPGLQGGALVMIGTGDLAREVTALTRIGFRTAGAER